MNDDICWIFFYIVAGSTVSPQTVYVLGFCIVRLTVVEDNKISTYVDQNIYIYIYYKMKI